MKQAGLFGLSDHLKRLSANGDPLEELGRIVDFEGFRPILDNALGYCDGTKGGRPPYDPVAMLKILILAAQNNVADARMEYLIRDRLSWMRFLGFDLGAPTPDANTIRLFREKLTETKTITVLFDAFDHRLRTNGYLAMGEQIVDATLVAAPKQRNTQEEKDAIKAGKTADEVWPDKPAKAAQKDIDARWTVKFAKARIAANGKPYMDIAIPSFGYKTTSSFVAALASSANQPPRTARAMTDHSYRRFTAISSARIARSFFIRSLTAQMMVAVGCYRMFAGTNGPDPIYPHQTADTAFTNIKASLFKLHCHARTTISCQG